MPSRPAAPPLHAAPAGGEGEGELDASEVAAFIRDHPATTGEVKALCRDLQVLGRSEFKQLLKWWAGGPRGRGAGEGGRAGSGRCCG